MNHHCCIIFVHSSALCFPLKNWVSKGGVFSPILFNIFNSDLPPPRVPVQVMAYVDDITITSTHPSTSAAKKCIQPYIHKVFAWTNHNNLTLNPDKTIFTIVTPDPAEYLSNLVLKIKNVALPMSTHPKVLGLTLDPKLTYSTHIHNTHHIKKKTLMVTYLQGSHETDSGVCLFHMVASCILNQH